MQEYLLQTRYTADFTGYSFTAGAGHYFVFNRVVPITLGYGFFYSYSKIDFDRNVQIYNGAKNASLMNSDLHYQLVCTFGEQSNLF